MASPIADLSYRNYDGPLDSPTMRWWVIAKQVMRAAFKKKSLWVFTFLSSVYYLIMMIIIFFTEQAAAQAKEALAMRGLEAGGQPDVLQQFLARLVWKDQYLHGLSSGQLMFFIIALLVGVGTIANDNRANALLVYLSKPCEKRDYVVGKWVGVFLMLLLTMSIPTMVFFAYGAMSYRDYGFLRDDPWIFPKLIVLLPMLAAFYASLTIGISSLFNQGRMAGAMFAGIYFMTNFFTQIMAGLWMMSNRGVESSMKTALQYLFYASIDGMEIGLIKAILGTSGTPPFAVNTNMRAVPAPPLWFPLLVMGILSAASLALAWKRVRAVEVVG